MQRDRYRRANGIRTRIEGVAHLQAGSPLLVSLFLVAACRAGGQLGTNPPRVSFDSNGEVSLASFASRNDKPGEIETNSRQA